jgi:hypothetical protein
LSRPRSGRAASGGGGSRPAGRPGVFVQTPQSDLFVVLLGISLGAMILGCLLLILVLWRYDFSTKVSALNPLSPVAEKPLFADASGKMSTVHLL